MPNPLTDELTDEAKAELAAQFAELKSRLTVFQHVLLGRKEVARLTGRRGW